MKYFSIASVISKSLITPSLRGRMAVMLPGVLPSISLATRPTAWPFCNTRLVPFLTATTLGSLSTIPSPLTHTRVLQVPRSMPMSMLNMPRNRSKITPILLHRETSILGPQALDQQHIGEGPPRITPDNDVRDARKNNGCGLKRQMDAGWIRWQELRGAMKLPDFQPRAGAGS